MFAYLFYVKVLSVPRSYEWERYWLSLYLETETRVLLAISGMPHFHSRSWERERYTPTSPYMIT